MKKINVSLRVFAAVCCSFALLNFNHVIASENVDKNIRNLVVNDAFFGENAEHISTFFITPEALEQGEVRDTLSFFRRNFWVEFNILRKAFLFDGMSSDTVVKILQMLAGCYNRNNIVPALDGEQREAFKRWHDEVKKSKG